MGSIPWWRYIEILVRGRGGNPVIHCVNAMGWPLIVVSNKGRVLRNNDFMRVGRVSRQTTSGYSSGGTEDDKKTTKTYVVKRRSATITENCLETTTKRLKLNWSSLVRKRND
eukprot:748332-Hanusia_phi.AAC.1